MPWTPRWLLKLHVVDARPSGFAVDDQWLEWNPSLRGVHARLTRDAVIIDVMRPRDEHEESALDRRRLGRPRDFEDAVAVLAEQREALDEACMTGWAERIGIADELGYLRREGGPP